jgi:hypothetical protein
MPGEVFIAYPSRPPRLGNTIRDAVEILRSESSALDVQHWEQIVQPGRFIVEGILERIDDSEFIAADITRLNFNVVFEIGYSNNTRTLP